jgi:hypothetical protein
LEVVEKPLLEAAFSMFNDPLFYIALGTVALVGAVLVVVMVVVLVSAGVMYGENKTKAKWIVELRRREHGAIRATELWQSKAIERAGLGPLRRETKTRTEPQPPPRRFVAPSQAINELKKDDALGIPKSTTKQVPEAIGQEFLKETAAAIGAGAGTSHDAERQITTQGGN